MAPADATLTLFACRTLKLPSAPAAASVHQRTTRPAGRREEESHPLTQLCPYAARCYAVQGQLAPVRLPTANPAVRREAKQPLQTKSRMSRKGFRDAEPAHPGCVLLAAAACAPGATHSSSAVSRGIPPCDTIASVLPEFVLNSHSAPAEN
jgi:hypothetical protein